MNSILSPFSRRWIITTILVVAGIAVLVRLGFWQLDRLEQRRQFNARVQAQLDQPALVLGEGNLDENLETMEYREVLVRGEYDHAGEIAIRNQYWGNQWGAHLVTPLRIAGTDSAILVDRGWIPAEEFESGAWSQFEEPGQVVVRGVIRYSRDKADYGSRTDPVPDTSSGPLRTWNFVNILRIEEQFKAPLLPVYIQQAPDSSWTGLPYRSQPELELSEGPHLGYAIQWFTFAGILGVGYLFFIHRQGYKSKASDSQQHNPGAEVSLGD